MNILFLGGVFPDNRLREIIDNSHSLVQNAANAFQLAFIKGLCLNGFSVQILTAPFIGNFPYRYKKIYFSGGKWEKRNNCNCVGFIALPILSLISRFISIFYCLISRFATVDLIFIYSTHIPFLFASVLYKLVYPRTKLCLIIPDLPLYMSDSSNLLYLFLKKIDWKVVRLLIRKVDKFVLIADEMRIPLDIPAEKYIRIEGICDFTSITDREKKEDIFTFLYTGTLDRRYGIELLLDSFSKLPHDNCQLWICGRGDMESTVIKKAVEDKRVKYFGQTERSEALRLQKIATVLVNPRMPDGEYTKYSFPSKTLEYLASGTPCLMFILPAMPIEYYDYIYFAEPTEFGLYDKMCELLAYPPQKLEALGLKAKKFVTTQKTPLVQVGRIMNMFHIE